MDFGFEGQSRHLGVDGTIGGGAATLDGQPELPSDGLVHVEHVAGGQWHIEQAVQARVQRGT